MPKAVRSLAVTLSTAAACVASDRYSGNRVAWLPTTGTAAVQEHSDVAQVQLIEFAGRSLVLIFNWKLVTDEVWGTSDLLLHLRKFIIELKSDHFSIFLELVPP